MKVTSVGSRGTGIPRWDWSGVAILDKPKVSDDRLRSLRDLLPARKSSDEQLFEFLKDCGARFARRLHQDEFGPTRADQIAAITTVLQALDKVALRLALLPHRHQRALAERLAINLAHPLFPLSMGSVLELTFEAVADHHIELLHKGEIDEASEFRGLRDDIGEALAHFSCLDDSSHGSLVSCHSRVPTNFRLSYDMNAFDTVYRRLAWLRNRLAATIKTLRARKGPEAANSLYILIWTLCDCWTRETGEVVTSSAVQNGQYTSQPQSLAGRFVVSVVESLLPDPGSDQNPVGPVRARNIALRGGDLERAVHTIMRVYVRHQPASRRRGRRRSTAQ
jgi:hypothetical protein